MLIAYGDVITCSFEIVGDSDVFRFSGSVGDKIVVQTAPRLGVSIGPNIELFDPNDLPIASAAGTPVAVVLGASGTFSIRTHENANNETGDYRLTLERIFPASPAATPIAYGDTVADELNPESDIDLYTFEGSAGHQIAVTQTTTTRCITLYNPDGSGPGVCGPFSDPRTSINAVLTQTGTHVIYVTNPISGEPGQGPTMYEIALDGPQAPIFNGGAGFGPPLDLSPVTVKKNRVIPFTVELRGETGDLITDLDVVAPPVIQVTFSSGIGDPTDVTDQALAAGMGTDGNQFEFADPVWQFNLKTRNYTASGTYTVSIVSGDESEYLIDPPVQAQFVIP